jgi:hypothetical protein
MIKTFQLSFPLNYVSSASNSLAFSGLLKEERQGGRKKVRYINYETLKKHNEQAYAEQ